MELDFTGSELWVDFFADYPRCRGCTVGKAPVILKKGHTSPEQSFSIFLHRTETMLIKQKKRQLIKAVSLVVRVVIQHFLKTIVVQFVFEVIG